MIPCQWCRKEYPKTWPWWVCTECGFRVCTSCLTAHRGAYSGGGVKCSQCMPGWLRNT